MRTYRQAGRLDELYSRLSLFCECTENCVICSLHHKDNLTFVIIIIITTIIIVVIKFKLGLNIFGSHVGILSILPKLHVDPTTSHSPISVTSLVVELLGIRSKGAHDISLPLLRFLGALKT
jgi:hypothetical protein